eukprot:917666_1
MSVKGRNVRLPWEYKPIDMNYKAENWICRICSFSNVARNADCEICGTEDRPPPRQKRSRKCNNMNSKEKDNIEQKESSVDASKMHEQKSNRITRKKKPFQVNQHHVYELDDSSDSSEDNKQKSNQRPLKMIYELDDSSDEEIYTSTTSHTSTTHIMMHLASNAPVATNVSMNVIEKSTMKPHSSNFELFVQLLKVDAAIEINSVEMLTTIESIFHENGGNVTCAMRDVINLFIVNAGM